jgi:hypothetical protein
MDSYWNPDEVKDDYAKAGLYLLGADVKAVVAKVRLEHKTLDEGEILRAARMPPLAWTR